MVFLLPSQGNESCEGTPGSQGSRAACAIGIVRLVPVGGRGVGDIGFLGSPFLARTGIYRI